MLFSEQAVVILAADGTEVCWYPRWCAKADGAAKETGGCAVQLNLDPPQILADYRDSPPRRRAQILNSAVTPAESALLAAALGRAQWRAFDAAARSGRAGRTRRAAGLAALGRDLDDCALTVRWDQRILGYRRRDELQAEMVARHAGGSLP